MGSGPTVRRRQLGTELRRLRDAAGLDIKDAATHLECSTARVSRIENGQGGVTPRAKDVRLLFELYQVKDDRLLAELLDLVRESQEQGWWRPYESIMPSGLDVLVGLESDATTEHVYELAYVPGLLQTPEYARALIEAGQGRIGKAADRLVQLRVDRQKVLAREPEPLELWVVIDESALRRPIGGLDVMRAQVKHLIEAARRDNIKIQVLETGRGAHAGLDGPFTILGLPDAPTVVYIETQAGNLYVEKDRDVRRYVDLFGVLRVAALDFDQTAALLESLI